MQVAKLTLGILRDFRKDYTTTTTKLIQKYGDKFALKSSMMSMHMFTDPKFLEYVLFKNYANYIRPANPIFDPLVNTSSLTPFEVQERWRKFRVNTFNRLMSEASVKKHTDIIVKTTAEHLLSWEKYADTNETFYHYPDLERMTLKNLAKSELGDVSLDVEHITHLMDEMSSLALQYELSLTKLAWKLPTKTRKRTNTVIREVTAISDKVIHHCLSDNVPDVLVFKDAVKSQGKDYHDPNISKDLELWSFLRSIAGGYITAGFDTLSRSVAVTLAYLSLFPAVADMVREEVKRVIGDGKITADNVGSLHYTRAVFHEGMRYSGGILPIMTRQALKDDKIGDYEIKKNDRILFPLFYMGHLEQYWENPEAFDPSRFLGIDVMDERYRYVYVSFSAGVRGCSGRHFAALEGVIILAMILKKYRLDLLPLQKIDPDNPGTLAMTLHKIA